MHVLSDPIAQLLGPWAAEPGPWCAVFRVALAVLLAAVIGWERSSKRHSAGLRTFMLISLAGCAAALLDQSLLDANIPLLSAAAIIGMAILSCNSILFSSKNQIKGLTTSAALWACGLVGVALGSGAYVLALAALPTAVSLLCTTQAIHYIGSTPTAILGALEPVTAVFFGVVIFYEELTARLGLGIALILVAVTLIVAGGRFASFLLRFRRLFPKRHRKTEA